METAEIEVLIEELEQRVERLRALYDQYFMGIEKIEPAVLRKDVDRRVWVLRREQIRNTGMRFKFNTVVQRYNTYQQYWMRICREIENGTYKRDLRRAAKKFGTEALTIQARKRLGKQLQRELEEEAAASRGREQSDSMDIDVELDMGEQQAPAPVPAPAPLPRRKAPAHVLSLDALDNLEDVLGLATAPERPEPPPSRGAPQSFGNIDDVFGGADERDETRPHERAALSAVASGTRPQAPAAASRNPVPSPLPPRSRLGATPPGQPPSPSSQATPPPASPGLGLPRKAPSSNAGAATSAPHAPSPPQPAIPARPAPPRPVAMAPPGPPARATASAPPKPAGADPALSETRVREIYARYVQAKRECRESTSGITEDGLSRSLRATVEKLKSQHKGRQIDFDVVIKDGKAVLKPVVKG